jgi:hypothetical protein
MASDTLANTGFGGYATSGLIACVPIPLAIRRRERLKVNYVLGRLMVVRPPRESESPSAPAGSQREPTAAVPVPELYQNSTS